MIAFFQTPGNFPHPHQLPNTAASGLAMTLASSARQSWLHPKCFHALVHIQFASSVFGFFSIYCR